MTPTKVSETPHKLIAAQEAEIAALREDALRYRWLRDVAWHKGALLGLIERYGPFEWDDAIDEARGEK